MELIRRGDAVRRPILEKPLCSSLTESMHICLQNSWRALQVEAGRREAYARSNVHYIDV